MHEAEHDVVHRLAFGNRDREGEKRDAALCVERSIDRVDDEERQRLGTEPADLLRDDCPGSLAHAREDRLLRGLVDRGRVVAAQPRSHDGLALGSRREPLEHRVDVGDRRAAELQPVVSQAEASAGRR